ncbi:hypothetical protein ACHAXT_003734 [Thalassiosira profunda]
MRTAATRGLPILAAAGGAAGCLAFRSLALGEAAFVHHSPHPASLTRTHHHHHRPSASSRQRSWALGGYSQVGDYFASFGSEGGDDGTPEDDDGENERREGKYMGHGRIDGGGAEGGVFDINNYFGSFGGHDDGHVDDGQDAPQQSIPAAAEENRRRQSMREMTHEEIVQHNNARLCPKMLLTQRAVQSFIYLLEECRDPHSGKWLEDFLGLENLGNYHGTGAFNVTRHPTWDAVLYDIMRQPNDAMIVSAKRRGRGHGGWSKDNPYLEERWVEFKIDIRPATLVQRLLPVRAQIADEFRRDLDVVASKLFIHSTRLLMCSFDAPLDRARQSRSGAAQWHPSAAASCAAMAACTDNAADASSERQTLAPPSSRSIVSQLASEPRERWLRLRVRLRARRLLRALRSGPPSLPPLCDDAAEGHMRRHGGSALGGDNDVVSSLNDDEDVSECVDDEDDGRVFEESDRPPVPLLSALAPLHRSSLAADSPDEAPFAAAGWGQGQAILCKISHD